MRPILHIPHSERYQDDGDEIMETRGMGAVYTHGYDLRRIRNVKDRKGILRRYYDPHHAQLRCLVEQELRVHGDCLIVDCHSFSSVPLPYEDDQSEDRPDICLGTDPFHTP